MEYAAGGDLFRYAAARRGLHEDEARWFFQQLILAVDYCHRMVSRGGGSSAGEGRVRHGMGLVAILRLPTLCTGRLAD